MNYVNHDQIMAFLCLLIDFYSFFTYIKMSKDSSAKFCQCNKEKTTKESSL